MGMIMIIMATNLLMILKISQPLKLSLNLTMLSSLVAATMYLMTNSMFLMVTIIISFSSGMMILFSYCSMSSTHESKEKKMNNPILLIPAIFLMTSMMTNFYSMETINKTNFIISTSMILLLLMSMVIISMFAMNITFFNPCKKLMQSY